MDAARRRRAVRYCYRICHAACRTLDFPRLITAVCPPESAPTRVLPDPDIDRVRAAVDAYESAKSGKSQRPQLRAAGGARQAARRGSRREALLQVIRDGGGLSRGEILDRMGLKGDKSGEMSVSNALTALTKSNQLPRREGKYHAG
jgi:hypothetical protein